MVTTLLLLDITRIRGNNENIYANFVLNRVHIVSNIIPDYPQLRYTTEGSSVKHKSQKFLSIYAMLKLNFFYISLKI